MTGNGNRRIASVFILSLLAGFICHAQKQVDLFHIYELAFEGSHVKPTDDPVRDIQLTTVWKHESGKPEFMIHGFWDGDGQGGIVGSIYKVRFCPVKAGKWTLVKTWSNDPELDGQFTGLEIECIPSTHPGFWEVDKQSRGRRWYKRSDGSHPYIIGNTMYSFVSEYYRGEPNGSDVRSDVKACANYYNKLRFAITGDIYPNPESKPFLDNEGNPTDNGDFSHRPNPEWFFNRVDLAVKTAFEADMIADIIMNGPDSENARSALRSGYNGGDPTPFLKYIAARYGSFPNVWFCLSNEYEIRVPRYTPEEIKTLGYRFKSFLTYGNPLSIHPSQRDWDPELNDLYGWNDHVIFQNKIKKVALASDKIQLNYWLGNRKPVINDELAYEGEGDGWTEADVLRAMLGAFLGGGYGSTGFKSGHKLGHYFAGNFDPSEHTASDNLRWFRKQIDEFIPFWEMEPHTIFYDRKDGIRYGIFRNVSFDFRLMQNPKNGFVIGASGPYENIKVILPEGEWMVMLFNIEAMHQELLDDDVSGEYTFNLPDSEACFAFISRKKRLPE